MNRRDVLRMGAAALLAAPFLGLSGPGRAAGSGPRRLLIVFTPNGTIPHRLGVRPSEALAFEPGSILEPLSGLEEHLLFLDNLDFSVGDNHEGGMANMLTAGGPDSLDQVVGQAIGQDTRIPTLVLGALTSLWGGNRQTRASYRGGQVVTPDDDPLRAWERLFGSVGDPGLRTRRQSVLDVAREELHALRGRLGSAHRVQLDAHLDGLRAVERTLTEGGTCEDPALPPALRASDNDAFPDLCEAQLDLAVQALACGATNVATVQLSHTVSPVVFTWLGHTTHHHDLSHSGDENASGVAAFVEAERWFAGRVAGLVQRLLDTPDPEGGSLLDSTVVLWAKELGDSRMHVCRGVPWVLAGGGDTFRLGRRVDLAGRPHDGVLAALANVFGLGLDHFGTGRTAPVEGL
jgi:hypothetical protein